MKTVVYDHQAFCMQPFGGISRYVSELAQRIDRAPGFRARVVAPLHCNQHLRDSPAPKLACHLPGQSVGSRRLRGAFNRLASPLLQRACRPSIVHRTYYGRPACPPGARIVVTVHDMIHELFPESFAADDPTRRLKRESVAAADHVVCVSHSTARDLMRLLDVPPGKITVTHLGFSAAFAEGAPAPPRCGAAHGRPYLLYVGQRKGYKNFATAWRAYLGSRRLRQDFDFVCFGGEPWDASELAGLPRQGLREGALRRLGGSDLGLSSAYAGAHALVYPSLYEGFGIPPLEAMSCACPVACSDTGSLPEVVGDAAELFSPREVDSMQRALERVCFDSQRRGALVTAGRERVRRFSWDRCAAATAEAYRSLLA